ncbi:MAG: Mu transposase C-terminal domain-containing protein [Actinomycetia bacterium]|nr:Mu transposase C-terminal domain-containing protein [Actinomycetes bacterium]
MNNRIRLGSSARIVYEGELLEIVEIRTGSGGNVVTTKTVGTGEVRAIALSNILMCGTRNPHNGTCGAGGIDEPEDVSATVLAMLTEDQRSEVRERASHARELLTGYRTSELSGDTKDVKPQYDPSLPWMVRYEAKAAELGVDVRTVRRIVSAFREHGEAGLVGDKGVRVKTMPSVDARWWETAVEIMVEHADQSRPSRTAVIKRTKARVTARYGPGIVQIPSRATAFRALGHLEAKHPTFRLSTKRNRDIAERNPGVYGKLRPTRPGQYLLMDTTRLDVFAMDPVTLRWSQVELTVAMDWYTRCITGMRLTPVSTKSIDAASVLYQAYRPPAAPATWPREATWPEHGVPRSVLLDGGATEWQGVRTVGPAIVPETLVVDHGKIYVSEHMTSVCQRMGISIQPARLRTGRDKGPVERFFRTIREDLLQYIPGYKGPDIHSRGQNPEGEAHFYIDDLESIVREWIATVYHRRKHSGLVEPGIPGLDLSPVTMFEHGLARAGYIEAPSSPDLAYEFFAVDKRTVQHYGVQIGGRKYNGPALDPYRDEQSPYPGGRWPIHRHPDDISRVYFRDPEARTWHTLMWEHAGALDAPFSEDSLKWARSLAKRKYTYPNDELAMELLLERWNLGLGKSPTERRMALRISRQDELLCAADDHQGQLISALPSLQIATSSPSCAQPGEASASDLAAECGDDDDDDDDDRQDFYASAWEDV